MLLGLRRCSALALLCTFPLIHAADLLGGTECLPKDVIGMTRGDTVDAVSQACTLSVSCSASCRKALTALQSERCFAHLSQPQTLQPRTRSTALKDLAGRWYGFYPASGLDLLELSYDAESTTLSATKLTGNNHVRAGRVTWVATPSGCRVVSSSYAGAWDPRWDPCTLTVDDADHVALRIVGADPSEDLTFVRATAPLLLSWSERRSPLFGVADALEACGFDAASGPSWWADLAEVLHHSRQTVLLDQLLMLFPLLLLGGWQVSSGIGAGAIALLAAGYCALLASRLRYLGLTP